MENLPRIVFCHILHYVTNDKRHLKHVVTWERVSKLFTKKLLVEYWPNVQHTDILFFVNGCTSFPMTIGCENFETIDLSTLAGFKQRNISKTRIIFNQLTAADFDLPLGFAASVPWPVSIQLGSQQNLNDPELLKLLQMKCSVVKGFHFFISNPTLNDYFVNAVLNFNLLEQITLNSFVFRRTPFSVEGKYPEIRKFMFRNLHHLQLRCLVIVSIVRTPGIQGILDEELFTLLELNRTIKCLHLQCLNHYIERWLANSVLHNQAQITNLCITNDHFDYSAGELDNRGAPLFHTFADYQLLFPKLQYLCIGISFDKFDDNRLDSMLLCYFSTSCNIKLRLTIRLFHYLEEAPSNRFDWVFSKLRSLQVEIIIVQENKTDARIRIKSANCDISSEIIVCFDRNNVKQLPIKDRHKITPEKQQCVDFNHCSRKTKDCFCALN